MADLKQVARRLFRQTLAAIDIPSAVERKLSCDDSVLKLGDECFVLPSYSRIYVVAIGKAAHAMVRGLVGILPSPTEVAGVVCGFVAPADPVAGLRYFIGGHPTPNGESCEAARAILSQPSGRNSSVDCGASCLAAENDRADLSSCS